MKKTILVSIAIVLATMFANAQDSLLVKANKDSAIVKINGKIEGKTPLWIKLKTKSYTFSLEKEISDVERYYVKERVTVNSKKTSEVTLDLKRTINPNYKKTLKNGEGIYTDKRFNKTYKTVKLGNDIWFAEPLMTHKYSDGKEIKLIRDDKEWKELILNDSLKAYSFKVINEDDTLFLYNWRAVTNYNIENGKTRYDQGICPNGWHIPNMKDIDNLLSIKDTTALKLIDNYFNTEKDNSYRSSVSGAIIEVNDLYFWTSIEENIESAKAINKKDNDLQMKLYEFSRTYGFPVRCVKNKLKKY